MKEEPAPDDQVVVKGETPQRPLALDIFGLLGSQATAAMFNMLENVNQRRRRGRR